MKDPERISRNITGLKKAGLDAVICRLPENVLFLSGWWPLTGTSWAVFTVDGQIQVILPRCESAEAQADGLAGFSTYEWAHLDANPVQETRECIQQAAKRLGIDKGNIGIERDFEGVAPPLNIGEPAVPGRWSERMLREILPEARFSSSSGLLNDLRTFKTYPEIEKLQIANEIAGFGLEAFRNNVRQGISEIELLALVDSTVAIRGCGYKGIKSARGFAQVSSGSKTEKAWRPCVITSDRILQNGDIVILELAVVADGFWADNTRVMVVGGPDKKQQEIYSVVLEAQSAAKAAIKPGVRMSDVDKAARDIINAAGYGKYFIHITGHGVGWRYHEPQPLLAPGNETLLQEGMVSSVEPGIYIPGFGGFRVEDNIAVTKEGIIELSSFNRDL